MKEKLSLYDKVFINLGLYFMIKFEVILRFGMHATKMNARNFEGKDFFKDELNNVW